MNICEKQKKKKRKNIFFILFQTKLYLPNVKLMDVIQDQ